MPVRSPIVSCSPDEKASTMTVSEISNWWSSYHLDKLDTSDSRAEKNKDKIAEMRLLSVNLNQTVRTRQLIIDYDDAGRPILSLRAPLDLVNFSSIFRPRWPIECEVISDVIHHIEWDPLEPEPFYQPTGHERTPMPAQEERGKVVYCTDQATKCPYFNGSRIGGSRGPIKTAMYDINQTDFTLEFESRFESGNLQKAVQVGIYHYELTLRTDLYTNKHTQWFYFRVRNMKAGETYRFTIVNLMKSSSLYCYGMKPLLYSERAAKDQGVGWQRTGSNIRYYRNCNQNPKDNYSDTVTLYSLTWTFQFPYDSDTCYLAHCYPYTYSRLQHYLKHISSNPAVAAFCTLRVLCQSMAGNAVYVVTITSRGANKVDDRSKKAVVLTARVHPGETNSSWMMEGLLDFLLGDSEDAQLLRDTFVFKIVPMLNPDGVVVGNYRCSLAGRDLNRNYKTLLRDCFPSVWHTRKMVERLVAERDVILYCDFHGHNRKNNVFMYGCNNRGDAVLKLHERVFPLMMSKNASDKFAFKSCKFRVQKSKEGTGRIVMWRLGINNSYTMEATFGGSTLGNRKGTHFSTGDLKSIGFYFCDTLLDYCDPDPAKNTYCLTELAALLRKEVRERLGKDLGTHCNISVSDLETSTSGSNSSDSDGLPVHLQNQMQSHPEQTPVKKKKKKRLRSHKERNRQRTERVKNNTQPKVVQSSIKNISLQESVLPRENSVNESIPERPVGRHRKKWQINGLIRKAVLPPPTAHSGEVSKAMLWQGCEPVKDDSLENMSPAYMHRRMKACPHLSTYTSHADGPGMYGGDLRCSSQLLHISAFLPTSPSFLHFDEHRHPCPRQSFVSYKVNRVPRRSPLCLSVKMASDVPSKRLVSPFVTDKFHGPHVYKDRNTLCISERLFVPDESSSHSNSTKTKQENMDQEEGSSQVDLPLLRRLPHGDPNQQDLTLENDSHRKLFMPVLGRAEMGGTRHTGIPFPVSKPSGPMKMELPHPQRGALASLGSKDVGYNHSGESQRRAAAAQEAIVTSDVNLF